MEETFREEGLVIIFSPKGEAYWKGEIEKAIPQTVLSKLFVVDVTKVTKAPFASLESTFVTIVLDLDLTALTDYFCANLDFFEILNAPFSLRFAETGILFQKIVSAVFLLQKFDILASFYFLGSKMSFLSVI